MIVHTLNAAIYCAPVSSISVGQRENGQVAGACDTVYGSEGWGFESLRARPGIGAYRGRRGQGSNTRVVRIVTGTALSPSG